MVLIFNKKMMRQDMEGGGSSDTQEEKYTPEVHEAQVLEENISIVSSEEAEASEDPEMAERIRVSTKQTRIFTLNEKNAFEDLGSFAMRIQNMPGIRSIPGEGTVYRTEFRPKQGLHNLDFTTPAQSEDEPEPNPSSDLDPTAN